MQIHDIINQVGDNTTTTINDGYISANTGDIDIAAGDGSAINLYDNVVIKAPDGGNEMSLRNGEIQTANDSIALPSTLNLKKDGYISTNAGDLDIACGSGGNVNIYDNLTIKAPDSGNEITFRNGKISTTDDLIYMPSDINCPGNFNCTSADGYHKIKEVTRTVIVSPVNGFGSGTTDTNDDGYWGFNPTKNYVYIPPSGSLSIPLTVPPLCTIGTVTAKILVKGTGFAGAGAALTVYKSTFDKPIEDSLNWLVYEGTSAKETDGEQILEAVVNEEADPNYSYWIRVLSGGDIYCYGAYLGPLKYTFTVDRLMDFTLK